MFSTILLQNLRIKIFSTHLDLRFSRVERGNQARRQCQRQFLSGGLSWGNGRGVWTESAGVPKTFPDIPFILSVTACHQVCLDHRSLLAVSTKWIMDTQRRKSSRGRGSREEAQNVGLSSKRFEVHSDQQRTYPPCFRISSSSSSSVMIKSPTQHSSLSEPALVVQDSSAVSLMLQIPDGATATS